MATCKLLYIDDEKDDLINPLIKKLESTGKLSITWYKPRGFEADISIIEKSLQDHQGILLDLQLNEKQDDGLQVPYQAPPLAQQIRTLATEGRIPDCPIILCSTAEKIRISYNRDFTSHNLFDWTFLKMEISDLTIDKLVCIIESYRIISEKRKDFSGLLQRNYLDIDERILSRFINEENPPVHEIARTIFKDLVQATGVLIDEEILAARLGVSMQETGSWAIIRDELFKNAKYTGVFGSSWKRWWADVVFDIFEKNTKHTLTTLDAKEKVELLSNVLREPITAAEPIKFCHSTHYWTICQATRQPIDPFEAFKVDMREEPKPWQDYLYVSLYALLERQAENKGIALHPSEKERYQLESESV